MRFPGLVATLAATAALGGCGLTADWELDRLRGMTPAGSPFTQALARDYQSFAEFERSWYDWPEVVYMADKGQLAAQGRLVLPDDPAGRDIDIPPPQAELAALRQRLIAALDANARQRAPQVAATAQVNYDCWLEQLEEGWQTEQIAACRDQFLAALVQLEQPAAPPAPPPRAAAPDQFLLFFDFDGAELDPAAMEIVEQAAAAALRQQGEVVMVTGHADLAGPAAYNQRLSERRARTVRNALVRLGVPAERIRTAAAGESDPLVPTLDGVREPQNRRVVINLR